jgi:hypothetical protein
MKTCTGATDGCEGCGHNGRDEVGNPIPHAHTFACTRPCPRGLAGPCVAVATGYDGCIYEEGEKV